MGNIRTVRIASLLALSLLGACARENLPDATSTNYDGGISNPADGYTFPGISSDSSTPSSSSSGSYLGTPGNTVGNVSGTDPSNTSGSCPSDMIWVPGDQFQAGFCVDKTAGGGYNLPAHPWWADQICGGNNPQLPAAVKTLNAGKHLCFVSEYKRACAEGRITPYWGWWLKYGPQPIQNSWDVDNVAVFMSGGSQCSQITSQVIPQDDFRSDYYKNGLQGKYAHGFYCCK